MHPATDLKIHHRGLQGFRKLAKGRICHTRPPENHLVLALATQDMWGFYFQVGIHSDHTTIFWANCQNGTILVCFAFCKVSFVSPEVSHPKKLEIT